MPHRNRVTPLGEVVATPLRGAWMGNRGVIHREQEIVRSHTTTAWITCVLDFRGWVAPVWEPGRWTALFFHDEAVALAAGHRPCGLCRHGDFTAYRDAVRRALVAPGLRAADLDRRLHAERRDASGGARRLHRMPWATLPDATFVLLDAGPHVVVADRVVRWTTTGYADPSPRPRRGEVDVITPPTSIAALAAGYHPQVDGAAGRPDPDGLRGGSGSPQGLTP